MGILDFEGGGSGNTWNFSRPENDNYSLMLQGDVVEVSEVQSINFGTKKPEFWDDGNPRLNICITVLTQAGEEINWIFGPGGRGEKASVPMKALRGALEAAGKPGMSVAEIGGLNITVATQAPPQGFNYGQGNPRPFAVQINGMGNAPFRGVKTFKQQQQQPQQPKPQPSPMQMQQPQPMQQQAYINGQQRVQQAMSQARQASMTQPMQMQQPAYYDDYVPYE